MPRSLTPLLVALLVTYSAQQLLMPSTAPLTYALGFTASQLSLVFTVGAVALTLSSPLWGWAFDAIGSRGMLIAGLSLCVIGPAGYAAAATFGINETLTPGLAFTFVLMFRSVLLGAGLAALSVAALAVAGTVTVDDGDRTKAVGLVGAAQGLATVIGPPVGGVLVVLSPMLPLYLAPALALVAIPGLVTSRSPTVERPRQTVRTRPSELLPAFGVGFLMYLSFALVQIAIMFLVTDRLKSSSDTGTVLSFSAIGLVVAQGVLVVLLKWPAVRLMRTGAPIALAGYAALAVAPSSLLMAMAVLVVAIGLGLAVTGFAATASLGVGPERQGLVAGLVSATGGLAFVIGPTAGAMLYEVQPVAPMLLAGAAAALAIVLSLLQAAPRPVSSPGRPQFEDLS